jgi:hypothetical protein
MQEAKVTIQKGKKCKAVLHVKQCHLAVDSLKQLEDMIYVKRSFVVSHKLELETANVATIPVSKTLDNLARSIEQLVNCTMSKCSHLNAKVKVICELLLPPVFEGKCCTYLVHKASSLVNKENYYPSAMQIAKVIDRSGSLLNISGYVALWKGVEADGAGKIE